MAPEADANAARGIRVEDLHADAPPNPFLFPRSMLNMHKITGLHPFLPAYPPAVLEHVQPNPIIESCVGKFFLSATMGTLLCRLRFILIGLCLVKLTPALSRLRHGQRVRSGIGQLRRYHAARAAPRAA